MTNEEKQLLLKDLCARLPYGVYCQIRYKRKNKVLEECKQLDGTFFNSTECLFRSESGAEYSADYKPYLRPMSSMTENEENEWNKLQVDPLLENALESHTKEDSLKIIAKSEYDPVDWLLEHHFDFRGLIEKNIALEAPADMYKMK